MLGRPLLALPVLALALTACGSGPPGEAAVAAPPLTPAVAAAPSTPATLIAFAEGHQIRMYGNAVTRDATCEALASFWTCLMDVTTDRGWEYQVKLTIREIGDNYVLEDSRQISAFMR